MMPYFTRLYLLCGGIGALTAVLLGAFGAHGLRGVLTPELMVIYHTGVQYQIFHSLGLLAVALTIPHRPRSRVLVGSGVLMAAGIIVFSGSLYMLSLTGARWLGAITPLGGMAFIAAWALFVVAVIRAR